MKLRQFSQENLARCEAANGFNHALNSWSLSDWMTATMGELGEAANVAKKLNRVRDGIPGNKETPDELRQMLADEIADTFIYLDLLAQSAGIDLTDAIASKFCADVRQAGLRPGDTRIEAFRRVRRTVHAAITALINLRARAGGCLCPPGARQHGT